MFELFRHLFLPHHTNNFRAKVLHADFFACYVLIFFILSFTFRTVNRINPDILGFATNIQVDNLLSLTNQKRAENGSGPLKLNPLLNQAAASKANFMFEKNFWAHNGPDGTTPWDFINRSGYTYIVAGENLAKNFSDSQGVVDAWMNSSSHRENLLRTDYQDIGFAVVNGTLNGEETTLVVQMFGKPLKQESVAQIPATEVKPQIIPPIPQVAAQTEEVLPTPVPSPTIIPLALNQPISQLKPLEILPAGSVVKQPLFDIGYILKYLTLGLSSILMIVLVVDGIFIWRRRIVRIGGRNIAHLLFLFAITGVIWFMSFGSVI